MAPVHVFFFRGLSTYGQDHAKWSIFDFGPISQYLAAALERRGIFFYPILGMRAGPLSEVAQRAQLFLRQHPLWQSDVPVHFLGHSAGGLIGRLLLAGVRPGKVLSLMTVASPHVGSGLAQICCDMPEDFPGSHRILRTLGYDLRSRKNFFAELTPPRVHALFSNIPAPASVRTASIVCSLPADEWCMPLRLIHRLRAFADFSEPSDGILERDRQSFGEVMAELRIDHFRQVGLFGQPRRFNQLCDVLADFFKRT